MKEKTNTQLKNSPNSHRNTPKIKDLRVNRPNSYAIVNQNGKILEKFRLKQTARYMMHSFKERFTGDLKIVELKTKKPKLLPLK